MSQAATIERPTTIAAVLDLQDPAERHIFDVLQHFYGQDGGDRLRDIKRGSHEGKRIVWTLGSFKPRRRDAKAEWMVIAWNVDEIEMRMQRCKSEREARERFNAA